MSLFAIDGPDGCGKTTIIDVLDSNLYMELKDEKYREVICLRMPGGTPFGAALRAALKDPKYKPCALAERLAFAADNAQTIEEVIKPKLETNAIIICDRWNFFTDYAYALARGVDHETVATIHKLLPPIKLDILFIFDTPLDVTERRKKILDEMPNNPRCRIEAQGEEFRRAVHKFYYDAAYTEASKPWVLAHALAKRVVVVKNHDETPQQIAAFIKAEILGTQS